MKTFKVALQTMCTNKMGVYLYAHTGERAVFACSPLVRFESISSLQAACEGIGVPCSAWGGPDSSNELYLSAAQLCKVGFKLRRAVLEWPAASYAQPSDARYGFQAAPRRFARD